jgi:putative membrane protein
MDRRLLWFAGLLLPVLVWSAVRPHDYFTWFLEVAPVFVGLPVAFAVQRRFPLSNLLLALLWVHSVILIVGGHYTYARVPLGDWAMEWFGWTRNNYDKVGHFAQGFIPAILTREILLRTSPLGAGSPIAGRAEAAGCDAASSEPARRSGSACRPSRWLGFLCVAVCLAFSAFYELIEWWVAVASGAAADDFLGTQGYAWDTQSDMAWALGGAILALLTCRRFHDRSLERLRRRSSSQTDALST